MLQPSPALHYLPELPVAARREEISRTIRNHQVVIVCGETGSGKTTQLPKICLELGLGQNKLIGHTQPRRIAARTVAARIASELNSPLGTLVGYKVRFSDQTSPQTRIKLMTDGILLAETQQDPTLRVYDTLIIDEAHERSLNIDFLLGYLRQLLPQRPDLKVIITSATIDAKRFSEHFHQAPVIEVSGRLYPVEIVYRPFNIVPEDERDLPEAIRDGVDEACRMGEGDILVFLPGEREIRDTAECLRKHHFGSSGIRHGIEILPLFSRLSHGEQVRIFSTGGQRRVVLATNVAETSLTVPGIRFVIDSGLARLNRYSYRNKVEQLLVEKISQASASQRAGRCGRVMNGTCFRLYSAEDFAARPPFTDPEILRSSLAGVILRMQSLKIGDVESFPFIQPPAPRMIADGYQLLAELGAIDKDKKLTPVGQQLARLPLDPKIGRMIIAARQENCLSEMLIITSALSVQDPRDRPFDQQEAADRAHLPFRDERSDFMGLLKLWEYFDALLKHKKSNKKLIAQCQASFISHRRMREWREIHGQLATSLREMGWRPNQMPAGYDEIHRALLAGLLGNIGFKSETNTDYLGARSIRFSIFPGSVLRKNKAKWVVAAELTETTRLYARCVATIDPSWLERIAGPLCKKHHFDPHWEKKRAQVMVFERVSLYGLTIVTQRRVAYGAIDPEHAREIFIREALVAGEFNGYAPFLQHNQELIEEIKRLESKARRQDILVDEAQIADFYAERIPAGIYSGQLFDKWYKQAEKVSPSLLLLTREILMRAAMDTETEVQFPESLLIESHELPLRYRFDPGHSLDGITVSIPLALLNTFSGDQFDWLVPGMIREKITWYLKLLPKTVRRHVIPLPDFVTQFLLVSDKRHTKIALAASLVDFVQVKTSIRLSRDTWENKPLPAHLQMTFSVVDDVGNELAAGKDLGRLQDQFGQTAQQVFTQAARAGENQIERDGITQWDFESLPVTVNFERDGVSVTAYPALLDQQQQVAIRLFDTREAAQASMRAGVFRLLQMTLQERVKLLEKQFTARQQTLLLQLGSLVTRETLRQDILDAVLTRALLGEDSLPYTREDFLMQVERARSRLGNVFNEFLELLDVIAATYQACKKNLSTADAVFQENLLAQLRQLIYPGFVSKTPWHYLQHYPRYLKAMGIRIDKYLKNPVRDQENEAIVNGLWQQYSQYLQKHPKTGALNPNLEKFRWQIEELRVSLFAQELKTPAPVSVKRLQKLWEMVQV